MNINFLLLRLLLKLLEILTIRTIFQMPGKIEMCGLKKLIFTNNLSSPKKSISIIHHLKEQTHKDVGSKGKFNTQTHTHTMHIIEIGKLNSVKKIKFHSLTANHPHFDKDVFVNE